MAVLAKVRAALAPRFGFISRPARRCVGKLAEWDQAGEGDAESGQGRLHKLLPFAIVAVSVGAAAMGWQASVADERATHHDEVSRQDLVRLAQVKLQKLQAVDGDLRMFGDYERYALLGRELRRDARTATASSGRDRLMAQAGVNRTVAHSLGDQLRYDAGAVDSRHPYDVGLALTQAETGDPDLSSVEPNLLRAKAVHQRTKGLHLTGLVALFIVGLVFFTLAAVTRGRRAYAFTTFGIVAALTATALFPFVRWT